LPTRRRRSERAFARRNRSRIAQNPRRRQAELFIPELIAAGRNRAGGGVEVGEDLSYGPARYFEADKVREIAVSKRK